MNTKGTVLRPFCDFFPQAVLATDHDGDGTEHIMFINIFRPCPCHSGLKFGRAADGNAAERGNDITGTESSVEPGKIATMRAPFHWDRTCP